MALLTLRQARGKLRARIRAANSEFAGRFAELVIFLTPVKTGRAKGGWYGELNVPVRSFKPQETGILDPSGTGTTTRAWQVAQRLKPGDTYNLLNGVPYIRRLEYGWSRQAPAGMVRQVIARKAEIARIAALAVQRQQSFFHPEQPGWGGTNL